MSQSSRQDRIADSLQDIIDNIARVELYVGTLDEAGLRADQLRYDAAERCLERICEATVRLGDDAETLMSGHPWRAIRGMGNRLRHAYNSIDFNVVWDVVAGRLSDLKADAARAREQWAAGTNC